MLGFPASATCICDTTSSFIIIAKQQLEDLEQADPKLYLQLNRVLVDDLAGKWSLKYQGDGGLSQSKRQNSYLKNKERHAQFTITNIGYLLMNAVTEMAQTM